MISDSWGGSPLLHWRSYLDAYGNLCDRLTLPTGNSTLRYDALVEVPAIFDEVDKEAGQVPVEVLPDDTLMFLLPSRFCLSDLLSENAWGLFGSTPTGWSRVQAVSDWVHENVTYGVGASNPSTTALDVWETRRGVCRDFAHLGITLCRALNIPARYVSGYIPDIAVPAAGEPMDFCSWFEVYLDGRWWTVDPRNNVPRMGRVGIGRGRDALDVAMVTTYGAPTLVRMTVWADEVPESR